MNFHRTATWSFFLLVLTCLPHVGLTADVHTLRLYEPEIRPGFVYQAKAGEYLYNHCASLAWFKDRWYAVWNSNTVPDEGKPGQIILLSTSTDFRTWTAPVAVFNLPAYSENPVRAEKCLQWQPNLLATNEKLWCVWSHQGIDSGLYISSLATPNGKWTNRRLLFDGKPNPLIDGAAWRLFPTQNPIRLSTGRILAPLTAIGPRAADAPAGVENWWCLAKKNMVLYSDDGEHWCLSKGTTRTQKSWGVWEPTVWELPDGSVQMFCRNQDYRRSDLGGDPARMMMLHAESRNQGVTWTPLEPVPIETVCSRMHVLPFPGRGYLMVHNDFAKDSFNADRQNLALFFSRLGRLDFIPAIGISGTDNIVAYPQMIVKDNAVYVVYTQGTWARSIKTARISPLPDPAIDYIYPRSNYLRSGWPIQETDSVLFQGHNYLEGQYKFPARTNRLTLRTRLRVTDAGTLIDTRDGKGDGFLLSIKMNPDGTYSPQLFYAGSKPVVESAEQIPHGKWTYLGVSMDLNNPSVVIAVNDRGNRYQTPSALKLPGKHYAIAYKNFTTSNVRGFSGSLGYLQILPTSYFSLDQHQASQDKPVNTDGLVLRFDSNGQWQKQVLSPPAVSRVSHETINNQPTLHFSGEASAALELPPYETNKSKTISWEFAFRHQKPYAKAVIATIGYADEPLRLIADGRNILLSSHSGLKTVAPYDPESWTRVAFTLRDGKLQVNANQAPPLYANFQNHNLIFFLGEGYPQHTNTVLPEFFVQLDSVKTRIH